MPTFAQPIMDEGYHLELVSQIRSPEGLPDEPYFRAPLYPYVLALFHAVTGGSYFGMRLIQIAIGAWLPVVLYLLGRKYVEEKTAKIAAVVAAVYPTFLYFENSFLIESLMVLLTTILLWQLKRCEESTGYREYALAGLLLGLAGIARPNILVFGPALIVWASVALVPKIGWAGAIKRYAVIGAVCVLVVLPVTLRNVFVADDFVLIAWQGGYNFFLGNNRESEGWSAVAKGIDPTWKGGYDESIRIAEEALGQHPLKRSAVSSYWYERGWEEIGADPGHFVALLLRKLRLTFNGYEFPNNQNIYLVRDYATIMKPLMFAKGIYFPYGIVAPLALLGLAFSLKNWRKFILPHLFLAAYIGTLLFFFTTARFRQPFIPVLILFAAMAIMQVVQWFRRHHYGAILGTSLVFLLLIVESNHAMLGGLNTDISAYDHFMLGTVHEAKGDIHKAREEYETALRMEPRLVPPMINLGILAANQNNIQEAARYFERALNIDPSFQQAYLNLANMLSRMERHADAVEVLERGRAQEPLNPDMHHQLALSYYRLERFEESLVSVNEALRLNPNNPPAQRLKTRLLELLSNR